MALFVVLLFTLPLVIVATVVAVKVFEFALNRDIASSKAVARATTLLVVGAVTLGVMGYIAYLVVALGGDPS